MKMVKSLLLGTAAGLVAMTGAQAADLPVKAKPVQYVKICSLYGAGFFYIPGTDTCIKLGGYLRAEMNFNAGGSFKPLTSVNFSNRDADRETTRVRALISWDVRSQTAYGTLRAYANLAAMDTNSNANANLGQGVGGAPYALPYSIAAFIQFAGFTAGYTASFFDFDLVPYSNMTNFWNSNQSGNGIPVFAYTAQLGNGLSASVSVEDTTARRVENTAAGVATTALLPAPTLATGILGPGGAGLDGYAGRRWPDLVANLRVDQAWGSAQVMGALHDLRAGYYATTFGGSAAVPGNPSNVVGWAVGAGLKFNLPMLGAGDYIQGQLTYARGAMNYVCNQCGGGAFLLQDSGPTVATGLTQAYGPVFDSSYAVGTDQDVTRGWSASAGYEHFWMPNLRTSLYGAYGKFEYSATTSARIAALVAPTIPVVAGDSASWSMWQVGSRTLWNPVQNLDLSVDILYEKLNTAFGASPGYTDKGFVSGMFRVQRNFWP
jgi:porin-like protein